MISKMKIGITGHRPHRLNNEWDGDGPLSEYLYDCIKDKINTFSKFEGLTLISGMALGVDQIFAKLAMDLDLPLIAAIPCQNHSSKWPKKSQERYDNILAYNKCEQVLVNDTVYAPWVMQKRNEWIVDNCDLLIAVFDGTPGGTANCVNYAKKIKKTIFKIEPI